MLRSCCAAFDELGHDNATGADVDGSPPVDGLDKLLDGQVAYRAQNVGIAIDPISGPLGWVDPGDPRPVVVVDAVDGSDGVEVDRDETGIASPELGHERPQESGLDPGDIIHHP